MESDFGEAAMESDFGKAFQSMVLVVLMGLCAFFIWQVLAMILLNNPVGDPTLKDLIISFFRSKRPSPRSQPSDHRHKNNHTEPPPSDLV
ncbi:hypothetical protein TIFTF001_002332 [Ficus carica]|uniref:Uncharacterized protein n=1 Tax=Ficus carica TaxID=3494 RepID=A0AA87Z3S0_FICCA|nr:hypothetical protein TIFTF001_002332 [Ficus carica]